MTIGERIKKLREDRGLSGEQLGQMIRTDKKPEGVGKAAVSHWEKGINDLTSSQIVVICEIFSVSADYLVFGNEDPLSQDAIRLAHAYDALDEEKKNAVAGMIKSYGPPIPRPPSGEIMRAGKSSIEPKKQRYGHSS